MHPLDLIEHMFEDLEAEDYEHLRSDLVALEVLERGRYAYQKALDGIAARAWPGSTPPKSVGQGKPHIP